MSNSFNFRFPLLFALLFAVVLVSCDSTEPDDEGPGEEELITRVVVTLTQGGNTITATANDGSGIGNGSLTVETLELAAGTTYTGRIELFNDQENEDITEEVDDERDEHQFFYTVQGGIASAVNFAITDEDSNGLPVGLTFTVTVNDGASGSGNVRIQIGHYDDAPKDGTTLSDETDIDFELPISVN